MFFEDNRDDIWGVFNARNIVFVAMLAAGDLCVFMSARNTAAYLLLAGMDGLIAIMTGVALIVFSSTSFTAALLDHANAKRGACHGINL